MMVDQELPKKSSSYKKILVSVIVVIVVTLSIVLPLVLKNRDSSTNDDSASISSRSKKVPAKSTDRVCKYGTFDDSKQKCVLPDDSLVLGGSRVVGCPNGFIFQDDVCIQNEDTKPLGSLRRADCPPYYHYRDGICYQPAFSSNNKDVVPGVCPEGYVIQNGMCITSEARYSNPTSRLADCPEDYVYANGKCTKTSQKFIANNRLVPCPTGYYNESGICKKTDDNIVPIKRDAMCPTGYTKVNGECKFIEIDYIQDPINPVCPADFYFLEKKCTKVGDSYTYKLSSDKPSYPTGTVKDYTDNKYYVTTKNTVDNTSGVSGTLLCTIPGGFDTGTFDPVLNKCVIPAGTVITNRDYYSNSSTLRDKDFKVIYDSNGVSYYDVRLATTDRPTGDAQPLGKVDPYGTKLTLKYNLSFEPGRVLCPTGYTSSLGNITNGVVNKDATCYLPCSDISSDLSASTEGYGKCIKTTKTEVQKSCPAGQKVFNTTSCMYECPAGYTDNSRDGICYKPNEYATLDKLTCVEGYKLGDDGLCYKPCDTAKYTQKDYKTCTKTSDDSTELLLGCGNGEILYNGECYTNCPTGYSFKNGNCVLNSPISNTLACLPTETKIGSKCYPVCPPGFSLDSVSGSCVIKSETSNTVTCQPGEIKYNGKCYAYCPGKFGSVLDACVRQGGSILSDKYISCPEGSIKYNDACYKRCPDGQMNLAETCYKPEEVKDSSSLTCTDEETLEGTYCRANCLKGYSVIDDKCYRPINPDITTDPGCNDDEMLIDNFCYKKCPPTYQTTVNGCIRKDYAVDTECPADYPVFRNGVCYEY